MLTAWILAAVIATIGLVSIVMFRATGCPKGGRHAILLVGRLHGDCTLKWKDGDEVMISGYIELHECSKCKERSAHRWIDWQGRNGGSGPVDVSHAEEQLRKAGILKGTMQEDGERRPVS